VSQVKLQRRGFQLGAANHGQAAQASDLRQEWLNGNSIHLAGLATSLLKGNTNNIDQSAKLYLGILDEVACDELFMSAPYENNLEGRFESLGSSFNEGEPQEVEMVVFDALEQEKTVAEDLWVKVSWLSFHDEDSSLRFRFSFGEDHIEDVAADPLRQHYAALLTDSIFPESKIITDNPALVDKLTQALDKSTYRFVERIVYFNAPNGGAYLHHDLERGHAGIVYAQLSGSTYWIALPKQELVAQIREFCGECGMNNTWPPSLNHDMQKELVAYCNEACSLSDELDSFANSTIIHLINETESFVQHLAANGFATTVNAGDMMLLPQADENSCCWHSVFNRGIYCIGIVNIVATHS
jgi:hypothetical protein